MLHDVTVIIRSVGERTESLCKLFLARQVPTQNILIVREHPFSASMRKSFHIGIEQKRKWTLCIDADVLVTSNAVQVLVDHGNKTDEHVCEIQCFVLDKLTNTARPAGNHLYRTSMLPRVIQQIPEEGIDLRPEYYTLNKMASIGYPWIEFADIVGIHDYEQFYKDIFRKCYVHAHKNSHLLPTFLAHWRTRVHSDFDFRVALWGVAEGILTIDNVRIDVAKTPYEKMIKYGGTQFREKDIPTSDPDHLDIEGIIADFIMQGGRSAKPKQEKKSKGNGITSIQKLALLFKNIGAFNFLPYLFFLTIAKIGQKGLNILQKR